MTPTVDQFPWILVAAIVAAIASVLSAAASFLVNWRGQERVAALAIAACRQKWVADVTDAFADFWSCCDYALVLDENSPEQAEAIHKANRHLAKLHILLDTEVDRTQTDKALDGKLDALLEALAGRDRDKLHALYTEASNAVADRLKEQVWKAASEIRKGKKSD